MNIYVFRTTSHPAIERTKTADKVVAEPGRLHDYVVYNIEPKHIYLFYDYKNGDVIFIYYSEYETILRLGKVKLSDDGSKAEGVMDLKRTCWELASSLYIISQDAYPLSDTCLVPHRHQPSCDKWMLNEKDRAEKMVRLGHKFLAVRKTPTEPHWRGAETTSDMVASTIFNKALQNFGKQWKREVLNELRPERSQDEKEVDRRVDRLRRELEGDEEQGPSTATIEIVD